MAFFFGVAMAAAFGPSRVCVDAESGSLLGTDERIGSPLVVPCALFASGIHTSF